MQRTWKQTLKAWAAKRDAYVAGIADFDQVRLGLLIMVAFIYGI